MNRIQKVVAGASIAGATLVGGALGAALVGTAGAQSSGSSSTTAPSADSTAPAQGQTPQGRHGQGTPDWTKGGHQANGTTETVLTGDDATKATAAAEAAVPGATAQRAETDAEGAAYEVHMTKSDGSIVTVKLDSSFNVASTIDGMG